MHILSLETDNCPYIPGGGEWVTPYIWHSTDVRAEWPPFFSAAMYMISPLFFNKKYMTDPILLDSYVKGPTFLTSPKMRIFFRSEICQGRLFSWYSMNWLLYLSNYQQQMGIKIKGQYMNKSTFRTIVYELVHFFKGQVYEWGRFRNTIDSRYHDLAYLE